MQRNHPEGHLSPELDDVLFSNDILDPATATAYTSQNIDGSTKTSASQAETGPIVLQLSYSVSHDPIGVPTSGTNDRVLSCLRVRLGGS